MDTQIELKKSTGNKETKLEIRAYNLTKGKLKVIKVFFKTLGIEFKEDIQVSKKKHRRAKLKPQIYKRD